MVGMGPETFTTDQRERERHVLLALKEAIGDVRWTHGQRDEGLPPRRVPTHPLEVATVSRLGVPARR
jgi:hypothetical protein